MVVERGIQLNRCAKHFSARELTSSDSGSRGGRGCPKFSLDFGEGFKSRPTRLLLLVCWTVGSAFKGEVEKSNKGLPPSTVGLALLTGDIPWVGEGGGVTVVATRRCFSKTLSNSCVSRDSTPGTSISNKQWSSLFLAILRSSLGEAISSDAVCSITRPKDVVEGCWTSWKQEKWKWVTLVPSSWMLTFYNPSDQRQTSPVNLWAVMGCGVWRIWQVISARLGFCLHNNTFEKVNLHVHV